jgi:hypothetical protein
MSIASEPVGFFITSPALDGLGSSTRRLAKPGCSVFSLSHTSIKAIFLFVADRLIFLLLRVICNCPWTLFLMVKEPALGL